MQSFAPSRADIIDKRADSIIRCTAGRAAGLLLKGLARLRLKMTRRTCG